VTETDDSLDSEASVDEREGSELVEAHPEQATLTVDSALLVVESTQDPNDFTLDYDQAVDLLEAQYVDQAMASIRETQPEDAASFLGQANQLRGKYLDLLESASTDAHHELHDDFGKLREFALAQQSLLNWLTELTDSLRRFRRGEWTLALETLNTQGQKVRENLDDAKIVSLLALIAAASGESLAGEIRSAVQDYGGARAAFDRAASLFQRANKTIVEDDPAATPTEYTIRYAEASALRAKLAQLLQANDYRGAAETARSAAAGFTATADLMLKEDPPSEALIAPLIRAYGHELLGKAQECEAEIALEHGDWSRASDHAKQAGQHYDEASKECLVSVLPVARVTQERMLNAGFIWGVQFRRRLDREKQARDRLEETEKELQEFYTSVRKALQPAGVTIKNQADAVNSVNQQVETVTRIENHARTVLREVPGALAEINLPEQERQELADEAVALANEPEGGPGFLKKVGNFASKLQATVVKTGEAAAPILALLKALAILG
jgi:hypothetical protein